MPAEPRPPSSQRASKSRAKPVELPSHLSSACCRTPALRPPIPAAQGALPMCALLGTCLLAAHPPSIVPSQPGMVLPAKKGPYLPQHRTQAPVQGPCFTLQSRRALRAAQLLTTHSKAATGSKGAAKPAVWGISNALSGH